MGAVAETIRAKLQGALSPSRLDVVDESHLHAGHAGAREGGESHFQVTMVAEAFAGQNAVTRQRTVYRILREELAGPVHALGLSLRTPGETGEAEPS
jgi:BolA protein